MIITCGGVSAINELKLLSVKHLKMNDLDNVHYFLGIKVAYSPRGYLFFKFKYITDIIEHARFSDTKATYSLLELNVKYDPFDVILLPCPNLYHTLVEKLVYHTITISDISDVIHIVSKFVISPL